jgi:hypothetical protein
MAKIRLEQLQLQKQVLKGWVEFSNCHAQFLEVVGWGALENPLAVQ